MTILEKSLQAWNSHAFNTEFQQALKAEIASLGTADLPLQEGLSQSSFALDDALSANILTCTDEGDFLAVKAGLFYTGIIAGCNCADDPTPSDVNTEYCEVMIHIDKRSAHMTVNLLDS